MPLTEHTGSIQISCESGNSVYLPYSIMAVSVANGALLVDVTDEFTTNTNGGNGPHVEGAEVTLTGYYSHETVAHGFTTADGTKLLRMADRWKVEISIAVITSLTAEPHMGRP